MDEAGFAKFISRLVTFFERKPPSQASVELWLEELQHIPGVALPWIEDRLRELEAWPRNLPGQIRRFWHDWRAAHPDKRAREEIGCDFCHQGYLLLSQKGANDLHRCICNGGKTSRSDLVAEGWEQPVGAAIQAYHKPFPRPNFTPPPLEVPAGINSQDIENAIPF